MSNEWEFDLQLFSAAPIDGEPDEDLELPDDSPEDGAPGDSPEGDEPEGEEEEMPDDLLSESELAERQAQRAAAGPAPREPAELPETRDAVLTELREIFGTLRQQPASRLEQPAAPKVPAELQPLQISDEQAEKITNDILSKPGGLARALAWAINFGDRRAMARVAASTEGQAAIESTAEAFTERFVSRKVRDPNTKFAKAIEPVFQSMLDGMDLKPLASMNKSDRDEWLEDTWERAGFRALTKNAGPKRAPAPGVGRGSSRGGPPNRFRVVKRMSDEAKRQLRASAPRTFSGPEGEKRFQRQVWELEHGITSDPAVRAMTRESMRFSESVGFGG